MRILYLTTVFPRAKTGGEIASQQFIEALRTVGHNVTVIAYERSAAGFKLFNYEVSAGARFIESTSAPLAALLCLLRSVIHNSPYSATKYVSAQYKRRVCSIFRSSQIDIAIVEHSQLGWIADYLPPTCPVIFNTQNVEHELYDSLASKERSWKKILYHRESRLMRTLETRFANRSTAVWTLTQDDAASFSRITGGTRLVRNFTIPGQVSDIQECVVAKRFDVALIGTWTWDANAKGLRWFFSNVYPLLAGKLSIHVAGVGADWVRQIDGNVHYDGFVDDAQKFLVQAKAIAIPAVSGGGIQIKTLDAIGTGLPIVVTPVGMRGIEDEPPTVVTAADAISFAEALVAICSAEKQLPSPRVGMNWAIARRAAFLQQVEIGVLEATGGARAEACCTRS